MASRLQTQQSCAYYSPLSGVVSLWQHPPGTSWPILAPAEKQSAPRREPRSRSTFAQTVEREIWSFTNCRVRPSQPSSGGSRGKNTVVLREMIWFRARIILRQLSMDDWRVCSNRTQPSRFRIIGGLAAGNVAWGNGGATSSSQFGFGGMHGTGCGGKSARVPLITVPRKINLRLYGALKCEPFCR